LTCCRCGSNDTNLVFILNFLSRPRAESRWPEPNGLLALPTQNQTLCRERVPRQETIAHIFGIGAIELRVRYSSSSAQLPLQSCVDSARRFVNSKGDCAIFTQRLLVWGLPSSARTLCPLASGVALRLKDGIDSRAGAETERFYSCLDSEEFCFNGGRFSLRGRICRILKEEFQEKELIPNV